MEIFLEVKLREFELYWKMLLLFLTENYSIWSLLSWLTFMYKIIFEKKGYYMINLMIKSQGKLSFLSLVTEMSQKSRGILTQVVCTNPVVVLLWLSWKG